MRMSEVKKRPQLNLRELYQLNWFLGAALALLSLWPVFYLDFAVLPHAWLATSVIVLSLLRPQVTTLLPRPVWQAIPFLLVVLLALDLRFSGEVVPPLVRLNILLVLYRCLFFRRKREDLQLIVLCLFLVIIAGVETVAVTFVLQVLLFTAVSMAFLFNITLTEDSRDALAAKEIWRDFTWGGFVRKLWTRCDRGFVAVAGMAFSSVIVFSVLLFLLIPRFDLDTPLPFLGMQGAAKTGFSESISFGDVTDIQNDNRVALRVEVDSQGDIPQDPYWRMLVLDQYENGGFRLSPSLQTRDSVRVENKARRITFRSSLIDADEPPEAENVWTFYLEGGIARYLPLTGRFRDLRLQDPHDLGFTPATHTLGTARVNSGLMVYRVEDMEYSGVFEDPDFGTYTFRSEWHPEASPFFERRRRVGYPDTTMDIPLRYDEDVAYLEALVDEIGGGEALTAVEFTRRATEYLKNNYFYSMTYSLPDGDGDHVVRWLQSGQPGHCEVFAGALILICRTAGIPARAVTGFRGGSWNTYENYFMVRNSHAHAWVEIFDGHKNWVRFDPTPGGSSAGDDAMGAAETAMLMSDSSFAAYLDSLRILWYRRIVSFDQDSQVELWAMIQESYSRISVKEWLDSVASFLAYWWKAPWDLGRLVELLGILVVVGFFFGLIAFCVWRDQIRDLKSNGGRMDPIRRKAGRYLQRMRTLSPPRFEVDAFYGVVNELERLRFGPPGETPSWRETIKRARRVARDECRRRRRRKTSSGTGA